MQICFYALILNNKYTTTNCYFKLHTLNNLLNSLCVSKFKYLICY